MRALALLAIAVTIDGCAVATPLAIVGSKGEVFVGSTYADLSTGRFDASDGKIECHGKYDQFSMAIEISVLANCSDGRTWIGFVQRDPGLQSGFGTLQASDGETARFIFGAGASGAIAKTGD